MVDDTGGWQRKSECIGQIGRVARPVPGFGVISVKVTTFAAAISVTSKRCSCTGPAVSEVTSPTRR